jgi:hypothetical protein
MTRNRTCALTALSAGLRPRPLLDLRGRALRRRLVGLEGDRRLLAWQGTASNLGRFFGLLPMLPEPRLAPALER